MGDYLPVSAAMAARSSLTVEDFSCPVCCDVFRDPLLLACSHSICKACLLQFWEKRDSKECPVCRSISPNPDPPCNIALKGMCEAVLQERSRRAEEEAESSAAQGLCSLHGERLTCFCLEEKRLACEKCRDPKHHRKGSFHVSLLWKPTNYSFLPIDEAVMDNKKEIKSKLKPLQEKLKVFEEFKLTCDLTAQHIKSQAQHTERQIKEEFEKLHQFLRDEEAARIAALMEEEELKSQLMKKKTDEISGEISCLSDTIKAIEEELGAEDTSFLQKYKATVERAQYTLKDPERVSEALINVAKHLGNLKFKVWEEMQAIVQYTPVTLDANTAHTNLVVSDDLTSVRLSDDRQQIPDNLERIDGYTSVLGSEGFSSGTRCWDIEVGDSTAWAVGVITQSVYKKRENLSKYGLWYVGYSNGNYGKGYSPNIVTLLRVSQKVQRMRVQLDWDKGKLSFTDAGRNTCLHVFKHPFTETVFPYFYNHCKLSPLKIVPVRSSVTVEQHS